MFKDTYIIDYPGISINNNEYEFKNKLLENIVVFLKDLGEEFALVGKEYELSIGD
ncbi:MAG: PDDEXK nuclease domain-containing protein [Anaeroplasma sp.]|nr:PDDEXK nuclease domain-containing protein [Anaeroplasma sp.]